MTTVVSIVLYLMASFAAAVFNSSENDEKAARQFWAIVFLLLFLCASILQVFGAVS